MYSDINEAEEIEEASIWTRTGMMVENCLQKDIIGSSFSGPIGTANETNIENLSAYIMECSILPHFGLPSGPFNSALRTHLAASS